MNYKYYKEIDKNIYYPDKTSENIDLQVEEIFVKGHYEEGRKRAGVVLDLGGNVGLTSLYFSPVASKIYVLEPIKEYFECLKKNLKGLSNIEAFNVAIGLDDGSGLMKTVNNSEFAFSLFGNGREGESGTIVKTVRIDTFFEQNKIEHIDVMKIDIEGMEYALFGGDTFEKVAPKIDFIVGESHFFPGWPEIIPPLLSKFGYTVEFLPYENLNKTLIVKEQQYTQNFKTMFIAYRI